MIRLVNIDSLSPTSLAWEDVLKLEIWEPKDVVLWYLTQNNIKRIDDTRKGCEKTYELVQHGQWIGEPGMFMCSVCYDAWGTENEEMIKEWNYCPNCGAKMEERNDKNSDE